MNIRQAARWAEKKGCVYRVRNGAPDLMYAVWAVRDHSVLCLGYRDRCAEFMTSKGANLYFDPALRMEPLQEVLEGMYEEEGERGCYLGVREEGYSEQVPA